MDILEQGSLPPLMIYNKNTIHIFYRALQLFIFGCILSTVLISCQYEHNISLFDSRLLLRRAIWIISFCGFSAVFIGLFYPNIAKQSDILSALEYDKKKPQIFRFEFLS
ncbi:unnamed protein product [Didymodactylos carnosus]|uniref:Uncharacterized protein n=1 Tax=Didymodactylos carnosus TaxID=1234261 RepID=A0A814Z7R2_9BILA|nr:unnamed protein product [Didymodactylos carnosus]CAF4000883.1 unnamed protein product [Didymodactylos carnosus]